MLDAIIQDLRHACRVMLKQWAFTAIAVATLALGIAATTVIFSAAEAVLLRPLPYREPGQLVWFFAANYKIGYTRLPVNWAPQAFEELQKHSNAFSEFARLKRKDFVLVDGDGAEQLRGMRASANVFDLLGVRPALGRTFLPEENELGRHRVVLISHELWQRRFNSDSNVIGRAMHLIDTELNDRDGAPHDTLDPQRYVVVGVLPPRFEFPLGAVPKSGEFFFGGHADVWEPESLTTKEREGHSVLDLIIGRLKPGVSLVQADADTRALFARVLEYTKPPESGYGVELLPLTKQVAGNARGALLMLMGVTGFVLLIGCVNVANLLLARAAARRREFAVRAALGASRRRLLRQALAESLVLAIAGGAAGLLLSYWGIGAVRTLAPDLPRVAEVHVGLPVLTFTGAVTLLSALLCGMAPAVQTSTAGPADALKEGGAQTGASLRAGRLGSVFVVTEMALSLTLLIGAGLLINSFIRLQQVDPGFQASGVLTLHLSFGHPKYQNDANGFLIQPLLDQLRGLPGVESAAMTSWAPVQGGRERFAAGAEIEGDTSGGPSRVIVSRISFVTQDYFRTMGIGLLRGHEFSLSDMSLTAPPVWIASESFARRYFPGRDPLGRRIRAGPWGEIVGVVKDTREAALDEPPEPHLYRAGIHTGPLGLRGATVVLRTSGDPRAVAAAVEQVVHRIDPDQPLHNAQTLRQALADSVAERRFQTVLLTTFAAVALLLAAVGIFGVMAHAVTRRTREIGIRMSLGANPSRILILVMRRGLMLTLLGAVIGIAGGLALTRILAHQLFGVTPTDPLTFAGVSLLLVSVAVLACAIPAACAARVDPMAALRCE